MFRKQYIGLYIYVYSSRRQNTALNRDKNRQTQTDRQTDTQTHKQIYYALEISLTNNYYSKCQA